MRYRVTALTPLLVGDGQKLSPIDYMVWKDHVNVLDQRRIFRLLAKGPRLDGYLNQLKRADKLDFASWGGFAQNFAGRRIPFEHSSLTAHWERASGDSLHIPTFACGVSGPYLPGAAIKGALRTGQLFASLKEGSLKDLVEKFRGERPPRHPAIGPEEEVLGHSGRSRMRAISAGDSQPVSQAVMKVYLLRVSTLLGRGQAGYTLGWKPNPLFAEMAPPGTTFEGAWQERNPGARSRIFEASNLCAAEVLTLQKQYVSWTGLSGVGREIQELETRLATLDRGAACLLSIGWGGGLLSKTAWLGKDSEDHSQILRSLPFYSRAVASGMPFPKTRRIVCQAGEPATLPGWVLLEVV